jgi:hypothetical protein
MRMVNLGWAAVQVQLSKPISILTAPMIDPDSLKATFQDSGNSLAGYNVIYGIATCNNTCSMGSVGGICKLFI